MQAKLDSAPHTSKTGTGLGGGGGFFFFSLPFLIYVCEMREDIATTQESRSFWISKHAWMGTWESNNTASESLKSPISHHILNKYSYKHLLAEVGQSPGTRCANRGLTRIATSRHEMLTAFKRPAAADTDGANVRIERGQKSQEIEKGRCGQAEDVAHDWHAFFAFSCNVALASSRRTDILSDLSGDDALRYGYLVVGAIFDSHFRNYLVLILSSTPSAASLRDSGILDRRENRQVDNSTLCASIDPTKLCPKKMRNAEIPTLVRSVTRFADRAPSILMFFFRHLLADDVTKSSGSARDVARYAMVRPFAHGWFYGYCYVSKGQFKGTSRPEQGEMRSILAEYGQHRSEEQGLEVSLHYVAGIRGGVLLTLFFSLPPPPADFLFVHGHASMEPNRPSWPSRRRLGCSLAGLGHPSYRSFRFVFADCLFKKEGLSVGRWKGYSEGGKDVGRPRGTFVFFFCSLEECFETMRIFGRRISRMRLNGNDILY
ncbi:hypothetical protein CCUS01_05308 [Colletotrichum cuscutae]|uniref:Uncharacterized protein n=1 Tax=Colletotrichum cuscutae TaxID=1209917 RepID=A0AAI9V874_9PEZI|nr:hypothetical protein CCUS01_05308 [Colletotrichum cuscutae]